MFGFEHAVCQLAHPVTRLHRHALALIEEALGALTADGQPADRETQTDAPDGATA